MKEVCWRVACSLASGLLLVAAMPPSHPWLGVLGWVALAPVLAAARGRGFVQGFLMGLGACLFAAVLASSGLLYRDLGGDPSHWPLLVFCVYGFVVGTVSAIVGDAKRIGTVGLFRFAAWAVLAEYVLMAYLPGHLALSQSRSGAALALASATGIWGVSFAMWAANLAIAVAAVERRWRELGTVVAGVAAFLALGCFWGSWDEPGDRLRIAVIQTEDQSLPGLAERNARAGSEGAQLSVWPEDSGVEIARLGNPKPLAALSAEPGQPQFIATFESPAQTLPHNACALFSHGCCSELYFKRKPFGGERLIHVPGTQAGAARLGGHVIGLNVCFDSCWPAVMRDTANLAGVGLIALPTHDPLDAYGLMRALHQAFTPFRAAELGVPIARAERVGLSEIVDWRGRVLAEAGACGDEVLVADVAVGAHPTLYRLAGDWFLWYCILWAGIGFARWIAAKNRSRTYRRRYYGATVVHENRDLHVQ